MFNKKGQNVAEYSILIALVVAAAIAMQVYVKRGIQGRVADAVDHAPDTDVVAGEAISFVTKQYEPYYQDQLGTVATSRTADEAVTERENIERTNIDEKQGRLTGAYDRSTWVGDTAR